MLVFLNLGFIDLLSCTLLPVTLLSDHLLVGRWGCTTQESTCRRNVMNAARVWQHYCPIVRIADRVISCPHRL